jgi:hypothetical protein
MTARWRRLVHAAMSWVLVATIVVQVFLAGVAMTNLGGSGVFGPHMLFGYTFVGLASLGVVLTSLIAGGPRREAGMALGILILYVVQTALPGLRTSSPELAALHPVNAMFLFGLASWYAVRSTRRWQQSRSASTHTG